MTMNLTSKSRFAAAGIGALALVAATTAARADVRFHNITGEALHFSITCTGNGNDDWSIAPYSSGAISCTNGSPVAVVTIRTDRGPVDDVVRAVVHDGFSYRLGYDNTGDVSIAPGA
jgi:hypothetical protein